MTALLLGLTSLMLFTHRAVLQSSRSRENSTLLVINLLTLSRSHKFLEHMVTHDIDSLKSNSSEAKKLRTDHSPSKLRITPADFLNAGKGVMIITRYT